MSAPALRLAIAGLGAIGLSVAARVGRGEVPGLVLNAVASRDEAAALAKLAKLGVTDVPVVPLSAFPDHADMALECAPAALLEAICTPMLTAGRQVMVLSCGALLARPDLIDLARTHHGRIRVPTGALIGLDAVTAAAEGTIQSVRMTTRKPPLGLAGAPHLIATGMDMAAITTPTLVFSGTARAAAIGFPANVNVAAALSLAGIGPDRTTIEIWADPTVTRNCHRIEVEADSARFAMEIENVPSENPKTGRITALSALAALRKLTSPLVVGT